MSLIGGAARTAGRWSAWGRAIAIGEIALMAKRHLDNLDPGEGSELRRLITKSRGRPRNLSARERGRVVELARKLEPAAFARGASRSGVPLKRKH